MEKNDTPISVAQSQSSDDTMASFYQDLSQLPRAPKPDFPAALQDAPEGCCRCACGKKFILLTDIQYHHTGLVPAASDNQCKECLPLTKGFALIVCVRCQAVIAKMPPQKFPGGFELKADQCYHVPNCPNEGCSPGSTSTHLLEKYLYDKEQGYPVPSADEVFKIKTEKEST